MMGSLIHFRCPTWNHVEDDGTGVWIQTFLKERSRFTDSTKNQHLNVHGIMDWTTDERGSIVDLLRRQVQNLRKYK
jgi:hypothetical protein